MRAVNLIPADERRGAGGLAGRSGGLVYVVAGGLLVVVVLGVIYAFAVKDVANKKGTLNQLTAETALVQNQENSLQDYLQVHQLAQGKVKDVVGIAQSRFNWPGAMAQIALALPSDVTLTSFTAVTGSSATSATSTVPTTTTSSGGPSFSLAGCANSQSEVATVLSKLESVPSVTNVSMTDATKQGTGNVPNARKGTVSRSSAGSQNGKCPLVAWSMSLTYNPAYTVPNQKLKHLSTSPSTVSHSTTSSGGVVQSTQVAK